VLETRSTLGIAHDLVTAFRYAQESGIERDAGCYIRTKLAYTLARLEYQPASDIFAEGLNSVQVEAVGGVAVDMGCQLRAACALGLAELRAPNALVLITPLLFDITQRIDDPAPHAIRNPGVRKSAATALGRLGESAGMVPLSIKLMFPGREEGEVLAECMEAALLLDPARAAELIQPYMDRSADPQLVAQAAMVYARTGTADAAERVAASGRRLTDTNLRAVVLTLATMRTPEAFEQLCPFAASPRQVDRMAFIESATVTRDERMHPILDALAVSDANPLVRSSAKQALEQWFSS